MDAAFDKWATANKWPTAEQLANASKWAAYFEKYGDFATAELIRCAWSIERDG